MKKIKLNCGKYTLVDDEDFEWLSQWKWHLTGKMGYVVRSAKGKNIYLHRLVNKTPDGLQTDHINTNPLDNRRKNLRIATSSLNNINKKMQSNNTSGIRGVSWDKFKKKWKARIWFNNKTITLGNCDNIKIATILRREAELKYFGGLTK